MSNEENLKENNDESVTVSDESTTEDTAVQLEDEQKAAALEQNNEKTEDEPQPRKNPVASARKGGNGPEMSKLFKLVYYPVLALFVALMFVFSIVNGVYGYSPDAYSAEYYTAVNSHITKLTENVRSSMTVSTGTNGAQIGITAAREYIVSALEAGGFSVAEEYKPDVDDDEPVYTETAWSTKDGAPQPTVTLHTSTPSAALQEKSGSPNYIVGLNVTNIVAALPSGKADAGAIVITVRYDTRTDTVGAANAGFVANAMQSLIQYVKSGAKFDKDIVVVFTEDLDYSYGAYAFFDTFKGLNNVAARASVGVNLDAYGNSGTLALVDASGASRDYISAVANVSGSVFASSVVPDTVSDMLVNKNSVGAFGDVPAVQVAVLGGVDAAQSDLDNAQNLSQSIVKQQSEFIKNYIDEFASSAEKYGAEGDENNVFFSYLGSTVAYTAVASYVIGALILALIAGTIVAMALKKTFSVKKMFVALGVELLVVVSTLIAMLASYFLVTLMLTGFGVLPVKAITSIRYFNAGILIAAMVISVAAAFGFTTLYKKLFKVTSSDVVRGTAVMFGLAGAVMSFACPAYSFLTSWLGMLMVGVLLASTCLHKLFKTKFGFGMDRLYLYALPVALCLPLVMAPIAMLTWLLPLVLLPVTMTLFTGVLGVAVPYLDRTRVVFDKLAKKLPQRTIRVERTVTERVEDRAKRGKFTEKTYRKVQKEKIPVNYKNYFGISVLAVLGIVIALFSGGFGVDFGKTLTEYHTYDDAVYNNAIVYEWDNTSGTTTQRVVVDDLMTYKFARYSLTDLEWDDETGRYVKEVSYNSIINENNEPSVSKDGNVYRFTTFESNQHSHVTITIPSARAITKITIKETSKQDNSDYEGFVYEFNNRNKIVLRLPYGFGDFQMTIDGANPSSFGYEEYYEVSATGNDTALDNLDEWNRVKADYADSDVADSLRGAIVIKTNISAK